MPLNELIYWNRKECINFMEFKLKLKSDSYNSDPSGYLEIVETEERIYLKVDDREVSVRKEDMTKVLKVISQ